MTDQLHRHRAWDAGTLEVAHAGASQVVDEAIGEAPIQ